MSFFSIFRRSSVRRLFRGRLGRRQSPLLCPHALPRVPRDRYRLPGVGLRFPCQNQNHHEAGRLKDGQA